MPDTVNLNIRINRELKETADAFFNAIGLNMTTAITLFMRQSLREQKIPFELRLVPPFGLSGEANLADYRESLKQLEDGSVISFDSVDDLIQYSKDRHHEDSVY